MSDEIFPEAHPEETPDEGMGTAREEWESRSKTNPMWDNDFGMSAGYPTINDEAFPDDPGEPPDEVETPPEEAMQGAPIFNSPARYPKRGAKPHFRVRLHLRTQLRKKFHHQNRKPTWKFQKQPMDLMTQGFENRFLIHPSGWFPDS